MLRKCHLSVKHRVNTYFLKIFIYVYTQYIHDIYLHMREKINMTIQFTNLGIPVCIILIYPLFCGLENFLNKK